MLRVYHTVSSGLYLWDGRHGLLVDGLHGGTDVGMSDTPADFPRALAQEAPFRDVQSLLFTHLHPDHYDEAAVAAALDLPGHPVLYGPGLTRRPPCLRPVRDALSLVKCEGAYVLALSTLHDGPGMEGVPHHSYLIRMGERNLFLAGDACLRPEDAALLEGFFTSPLDAAFLNPYQLASPAGQAFVRRMAPAQVLLQHLPAPADDRYHYQAMARHILATWPQDLPPLRLAQHHSWVLELA